MNFFLSFFFSYQIVFFGYTKKFMRIQNVCCHSHKLAIFII